MSDRSRRKGWSFCIITDGRREQLLREAISSIRSLALPAYEIIVSGAVPDLQDSDITVIDESASAHEGRLGAMRNAACRAASYDSLVVADDDMLFGSDLVNVLMDECDRDVVCVRVLNPDGSRFWDWATHGGPRGHSLLDYDETDDFVYVTGGLAIMRSRVHDLIPWDDERGFYQGEDIDWSARLRSAGVRITLDRRGSVIHQDSRYSQKGNVVVFRQDLNRLEKLAPGIEAKGVFRENVEGVAGIKWMGKEAEIHAPARTISLRKLQFVISSVVPELTLKPFEVRVEVNGALKGGIRFDGVQSVPVSIALGDNQSTVVRLCTNAGVPATAVGIQDERPVSVLLHNAMLVNS